MLGLANRNPNPNQAVPGARACVGVPSRVGGTPGVASEDGRFCCSGQVRVRVRAR